MLDAVMGRAERAYAQCAPTINRALSDKLMDGLLDKLLVEAWWINTWLKRIGVRNGFDMKTISASSLPLVL